MPISRHDGQDQDGCAHASGRGWQSQRKNESYRRESAEGNRSWVAKNWYGVLFINTAPPGCTVSPATVRDYLRMSLAGRDYQVFMVFYWTRKTA
jgi:hypothetical protein